MTWPAPIVQADDEALVCAWLADRPELSGTAVGDRLPDDYDGTQSAVTVARIGGAMDAVARGTWLDRPRLDVSCWGKDKATAKATANTVRALLAVAPDADHTAAGAVWSNTSEDVGPQWLPSSDYPGAGRYLIQFSILIHPTI